MAIMSSVDIVLTDYKLSDAQKNAVIELLTGGFNTAKPNTIGSLVKKGLVVVDENGGYGLEEEFHGKIREAYNVVEPRELDDIKDEDFHQDLMASVAELEALLEPVGDLGAQEDYILNDEKSVAEAIYGDPEASFADIIGHSPQDLHESVEETALVSGYSPERFDSSWAPWERELMGFEIVNRWTNVKVWDGLTAREIRDDMDTEHYINRAARRAGAKMTRRAVKSFLKRGV